MKITVTKSDIKNGTPREASNCPIALALQRHFKGAAVGGFGLWWRADSKEVLDLPGKAHQFQCDFDQGRPVEPFTFDLPEPESALATRTSD